MLSTPTNHWKYEKHPISRRVGTYPRPSFVPVLCWSVLQMLTMVLWTYTPSLDAGCIAVPYVSDGIHWSSPRFEARKQGSPCSRGRCCVRKVAGHNVSWQKQTTPRHQRGSIRTRHLSVVTLYVCQSDLLVVGVVQSSPHILGLVDCLTSQFSLP